jgi:hypothetical protein
VYFTGDGMVVALSERAAAGAPGLRPAKHEPGWEPLRRAVKPEFVGARAEVKREGLGRTGAEVSYFKGPRWAWQTGLAIYGGIRYRDLWPRVDLVWQGEQGRLKLSFIVRPGADPSQTRLAWRGARGVQISGQGELEVHTPVGAFAEEKPLA